MSHPLPASASEVAALMPHRPPFLFVDRVTGLDPDRSIIAERLLRPEEPFFVGHFPGHPIMPGVLVGEALAQASGLLLGLSRAPTEQGSPVVYFLAAANLKFLRPAIPGETLILESRFEAELGGLFRFQVTARVGEDVVASGVVMLARQSGPQ
jgi:3-hydroxyacyl-[acyl-carrier-protein] dehydratase